MDRVEMGDVRAQSPCEEYYRLTAAGRKQLRQEHSEWQEFASAVARLMVPAPEGQP
jgi:DNA-binding PadR family transcriptional regulator